MQHSAMNATSNGAILVLESDRGLRESLSRALDAAGFDACAADTPLGAARLIARSRIGLVLHDAAMPLPPEAVGISCIAMHAGANDEVAGGALVKPFDTATLLAAVRRHLVVRESGIIANDPVTQRLVALAARVAAADVAVMLAGESGSGKEVFARFIHRNSCRANAPFVALNCAALPASMLEAILFGYEKGAFTGAMNANAGKFEQANGGTLLLDEITEMPMELQAKLLRVLQEREVERLGSQRSIALDIRVLATTNRDPLTAVADGRLREDLYYRLNVFPLNLPPLRERRKDILPLAEHLYERCARRSPQFTADARDKLCAYDWPGNVRELANVMQRALVLAEDDCIDAAALMLDEAAGSLGTKVPASTRTSTPADLRDMRKNAEADSIRAALAAVNGHRAAAAERLGISPRTLRHKLAQLRDAGHPV